MPDLTLGQAKTIAAATLVALVVLALLAAWVMKEMTQKVIAVGVLAVLVVVVWTQRSNLQQCADDLVSDRISGAGDATATCSFFGQEIEITTSRSS